MMLQRLRRFGRFSTASRQVVPYAVLALGLVSTAASALLLDRDARVDDGIRLERAVLRIQNSLSTRIETYTALLRATAGLFAASEHVSREEFGGFVERLDLRGRYPGIQGMGFAVRIPAPELPGALAAFQAEGVEFSRGVWPDDPRAYYHPIVYLEPLDRRNRAAVGYDMYTEPIRRAAMERAAREGVAATSGPVTLVQEIDPDDKQAGFLIYLPVYATGAVPGTEDERMRQLRGFVYSPFRAGDFLRTVLASLGEVEVSLRIYDGTEAAPERLLHDSHPTGPRPEGRTARVMSAERSLKVPGRTWTLVVTTLPAFQLGSGSRLLPWILAGGGLVTLVLFIATRAEVKARASAEASADSLRRSEEALRAGEAELRRLVTAEREAHAEAAAASRAKDEFLATLSHELRTPLNAILGWATMMKNGSLGEEQERRAVDIIARNARAQAELIEDLLDVSRIITGKLHIETRPVMLAPSVEAALDAVRPAAEAKGVALEWAASTEGPVLGDPDRLQQVAWNLLSNAIKFTPPGGRVVASLDAGAGEVEFRVSDTGVGVSPSFIPHMFERFRQHDSSTTRSHGGMGIGLAIVRHLVELHGGTVGVNSRGEGHGTTFTVRLPARKGGGATTSPADRQHASPDELAGVRALIVDDDRDSRELLAQVLTQAGATALVAASAGEALTTLGRHPVDVVLLDIAMPGADGYALLRSIRTHPSDSVRALPAVAVTAYARGEDRDRTREAGFQDHLAKPVEVRALRDAVRRLVTEEHG